MLVLRLSYMVHCYTALYLRMKVLNDRNRNHLTRRTGLLHAHNLGLSPTQTFVGVSVPEVTTV